jgi:hypothetical protein
MGQPEAGRMRHDPPRPIAGRLSSLRWAAAGLQQAGLEPGRRASRQRPPGWAG